MNRYSGAATVAQTLQTAADQPITHTSIWGKVFDGLVETTTDALTAGIGMLAGPEADLAVMGATVAATGTATAAGGALMPMATTAINAHFTTTLSQPPPVAATAPPVAATAPPVVNQSYSAGNLLGMLLANSFVQAEIGNVLGLATDGPSPLWSNYSIQSDSLCTDVSLADNLFSGLCDGTDNNGGQAPAAPAYTNVLSTYPNSQSETQLSIWDAILTGADVALDSAGYLQVSNPTGAAFSPPTQLIDTSGSAETSVAAVNTAFNHSSGLLARRAWT